MVDSSAAYTHAAQYKRKKKPMMAMPAMYMPPAWKKANIVTNVKTMSKSETRRVASVTSFIMLGDTAHRGFPWTFWPFASGSVSPLAITIVLRRGLPSRRLALRGDKLGADSCLLRQSPALHNERVEPNRV